jgi:uncharacterized protein involved in exopolysaccharide biosynthesis
MARVLETLFRHKVLILLPTLLLPIVVGAIAFAAPVPYESTAGIWVERATYISFGDEFERWLTPAQHQTNRLNELLRTRSFLTDVVLRSPLAPEIATERGRGEVRQIFADGLTVEPAGEHLLTVRFRAATPELAQALVQSVIETFQVRVAEDRTAQAQLAISFYEARLRSADEELRRAETELRRYVGGAPASAVRPSGGVSPVLLDPQLAELQRRVDYATTDAERARSLLDQAGLEVSASQQGQELGFQVVDRPELPTAPTRQLRRTLMYPLAGILGGIVLSALLLVLLVAADRSVRSRVELEESIGFLGVIPRLKARGLTSRVGAVAVRRGIAFVGGASLPVGPTTSLRA